MIISCINFSKKMNYFNSCKAKVPRNLVSIIKTGNILKQAGDLLLCPTTIDWVPSSDLLNNILKIEGNYLKKKLENIHQEGWIGSENVIFLPCKKLKYRGLLLVKIEFAKKDSYSNNLINLAEAFQIASLCNCKKLTIPANIMNELNFVSGSCFVNVQIKYILSKIPESVELDFYIENILEKALVPYSPNISFWPNFDFSEIPCEKLPKSALILPWYKKQTKDLNQRIWIGKKNKKRLLKNLTNEDLSIKQITKILIQIRPNIIKKNFSGARKKDELFFKTVFDLCKELPWNYHKIYKIFERWRLKNNKKKFLHMQLDKSYLEQMNLYKKKIYLKKSE